MTICRFSAFADIFSEAVKRGLKAIQVYTHTCTYTLPLFLTHMSSALTPIHPLTHTTTHTHTHTHTQTQNPGLYYHQAALSAIARKRLSHKLCLEASTVPLSELATLPEPVYYGQRPWRLGLTGQPLSE